MEKELSFLSFFVFFFLPMETLKDRRKKVGLAALKAIEPRITFLFFFGIFELALRIPRSVKKWMRWWMKEGKSVRTRHWRSKMEFNPFERKKFFNWIFLFFFSFSWTIANSNPFTFRFKRTFLSIFENDFNHLKNQKIMIFFFFPLKFMGSIELWNSRNKSRAQISLFSFIWYFSTFWLKIYEILIKIYEILIKIHSDVIETITTWSYFLIKLGWKNQSDSDFHHQALVRAHSPSSGNKGEGELSLMPLETSSFGDGWASSRCQFTTLNKGRRGGMFCRS